MAVTIFIKNHKGLTYTVALDDTEFQGATVLDLKIKFAALEGTPGMITIDIATVTQIISYKCLNHKVKM